MITTSILFKHISINIFYYIKIIDIFGFITIVEYYQLSKNFLNQSEPHMSAVRAAPGQAHTHQSLCSWQ